MCNPVRRAIVDIVVEMIVSISILRGTSDTGSLSNISDIISISDASISDVSSISRTKGGSALLLVRTKASAFARGW